MAVEHQDSLHPKTLLSDNDRKYWAGFLDSQGSIYINVYNPESLQNYLTSQRPGFNSKLVLQLKGLDPIYYKQINEQFALDIPYTQLWTASDEVAAQVLSEVFPFMHLRKGVVMACLDYAEIKKQAKFNGVKGPQLREYVARTLKPIDDVQQSRKEIPQIARPDTLSLPYIAGFVEESIQESDVAKAESSISIRFANEHMAEYFVDTFGGSSHPDKRDGRPDAFTWVAYKGVYVPLISALKPYFKGRYAFGEEEDSGNIKLLREQVIRVSAERDHVLTELADMKQMVQQLTSEKKDLTTILLKAQQLIRRLQQEKEQSNKLAIGNEGIVPVINQEGSRFLETYGIEEVESLLQQMRNASMDELTIPHPVEILILTLLRRSGTTQAITIEQLTHLEMKRGIATVERYMKQFPKRYQTLDDVRKALMPKREEKAG